MDIDGLISKLNQNANELKLEDSIEFLSGNSLMNLASIVGKKIPFSKVAIFSTKKSFIEYGIKLCDFIKDENIKPINIILDRVSRLSVDGIKDLFNITEDVRAIIITDNALAEVGLYYATVINSIIYFVVNDFNVKGITLGTLLIDNNKYTEIFATSVKRYVFLDFERIKQSDISSGIAITGAKLSAILDYKINCYITGENENSNIIQITEQAIYMLLDLDKIKKEDLYLIVLYTAFTVELSKLDNNSKLHECSSAKITALLAENSTLESSCAEFFCAKKIIERYSIACLNNDNGQNVCDYNEIATKLQIKLKTSFNKICNDILYKISLITEKNGGADRLIPLMKNAVFRAKKELCKIEKLYKALNGKSRYLYKSINENIELSGYVGKIINGMTLIKEMGF